MRFLTLLLTLIICAACMADGPYVELKGERFSVELAQTQQKQALGLMFRESMPQDHGMLFLFPVEAMRSFWMKNTKIPLDIFYFDADLKLVSVSENTPPCRSQRCPGYPSTGPAKYVLELNAGKAAELGVQPGDQLQLYLEH
ncbi:MAG: DUF192 domain-containing protein [Xanthomonadales bacterium]|jgi:uncharacterized membrane protein (UPF0127 family)|nr:DUF192 domain-containing protein [Xanthomonadales bacterium]MDH3925988.1 DUF192 domain-containing protein [Xanthomonadales bacterium]MDH3939755.1 DUF192 domain-containing protein [Xanthomonadales bacterium]